MSIMRKRTIAIIAAALCIIILGFSLAAVLEYVSIIEYEDVDGIKYYAKKDGDVYRLYAKKAKEPLALDEKYNQYYITAAGTLVKLDEATGAVKDRILVDKVERVDLIESINNRVLIYPKVSAKEMLSLKVYNASGTYGFEKLDEKGAPSKDGTFVISGSPTTVFDKELLSSLYTDAGYALATRKVDPIKRDENGALCSHQKGDASCACKNDYSEYGLVAGERTRFVYDEFGAPVEDEVTGEKITETYDHTPTRFVLTSEDEKGNKVVHEVILGDALVTGAGYYALYVEPDGTIRDRLYVLDNSTGTNMNAPIEDYVTPMMGYPMTMNRYYDVDDFTISHRNGEGEYDNVIKFSFVDLSQRENTLAATDPYEFELGLAGYTASDTAINACLYKMYSPSMVGTKKYNPSEADLVEYGFYVDATPEGAETKSYKESADYKISYVYDVYDDKNVPTMRIHQTILISAKDYKETTTYYTYTWETRVPLDKDGNPAIPTIKDGDTDEQKKEKIETWIKDNTMAYNFIAEVEGYTLDFVEWDQYEWVTPSLIEQNIAFLTNLKVAKYDKGVQSYFAEFGVNNSKSDSSDGVNSNLLFVDAYYTENGNTTTKHTTFSNIEIHEAGNIHWNVTSNNIEVYSKIDGKKVYDREIPKELTYYDYNAIGMQVLCKTTPIRSIVGKDATGQYIYEYVWVYKDYVVVTDTADPNYTEVNVKASYVRYDTNLFRKYYQTVLYMAIVDSYSVTKEEESAIVTTENLMYTLDASFKDSDGTVVTKSIKFYEIDDSARKIYVTVDGNGGFYLYKSKVEKLITDAQKFFANENFDPTAKR